MAVYSAISVDSKFFLKKGSLLSSVRNRHSDPKQKPKIFDPLGKMVLFFSTSIHTVKVKLTYMFRSVEV